MSDIAKLNLCEQEEWKRLVYARIEELGSMTKVAKELGYARPSLSLALRDKYIGNTALIEQKVLETFGQFECPFLKIKISRQQCRAYQERDAPTQNPAEMRHWRACQKCTYKIEK
ncbi:LysR family transcriptional regulator [Acinetobacter piscicola]|uniref:LysR family transcriptional regulator n=1 Tax=Acinetobacter piscicola TaxID=2006115 RepID=UPI0035583ACA